MAGMVQTFHLEVPTRCGVSEDIISECQILTLKSLFKTYILLFHNLGLVHVCTCQEGEVALANRSEIRY